MFEEQTKNAEAEKAEFEEEETESDRNSRLREADFARREVKLQARKPAIVAAPLTKDLADADSGDDDEDLREALALMRDVAEEKDGVDLELAVAANTRPPADEDVLKEYARQWTTPLDGDPTDPDAQGPRISAALDRLQIHLQLLPYLKRIAVRSCI